MPKPPKIPVRARERESLSIGALSRATRIPVETLRTWEQRYGSPMPVRKPSGHRVYAVDTVDHLRRVGRLLAHGHRPGEVLRLSSPELDRLLSLDEPVAAPARAGVPLVDGRWIAERIERMLRATLDLDRGTLIRELQTSWVRLGPLRCLEEVAGSFLSRVGQAWEEDTLEVRHEHFAFACVADFLRGVREPFDQQARGPRVVATTLPGEKHEGGLLMASVLLAVRGYRVVYLGLDTPVDQVAAATTAAAAERVVLSVSAATPRARAARELEALRKALPFRLPLWVGGAGSPDPIRGVERFQSLTQLDERLRALVG
jgi:methanogenic corrinoid protein MtbC1